MTTGVFQITVQQMKSLISQADMPTLNDDQMEAMLQSARASNPLFAGLYRGQLVCLMGLVPPTLISSDAYLWVHTTNLAKEHKVLFGVHSARFVKKCRARYSRLIGYCLVNDRSAIRWVKSLGGRIFDFNESLVWFEILGT